MVKPQLFLHIGMNKTGTSALQKWCHHNRDLLLKFGVLYPKSGVLGAAHYGVSDLFGFRGSKGTKNRYSTIKQFSKEFDSEVARTQPKKIIISSEDFVRNRDITPLYEYFQEFDCKIIVYLRRHDYWWESLYNQSLKMVHQPRYQRGIDKFIKKQNRSSKLGNYKALLDRWSCAFGKENIIVKAYERNVIESGIVRNFFGTIGENLPQKVLMSEKPVNRSLSNRANYILEVAQRSGLSKAQVNKVIEYLYRWDEKTSDYSLLSPERRNLIVRNNQSQYRYISKNFLDGKQLFSESLPMNEAWQEFVPPSEEEIVETIVKALAISLPE